MNKIKITYRFSIEGGIEKEYALEIDAANFNFVPAFESSPPEWTRLDNKKCKHCPLNSKDSPYCPVATNISHAVEFFKDTASFSKAVVKVTTQEREYSRKCAVQEGLFSLLGLMMPLSSCPYLKFLKPMARFHLPFSTTEETMVRSTSLYLLRQYFTLKKGGEPDLKLDKLNSFYEDINILNLGMIDRIRGIAKADANVNALIILHSFAELLTAAISHDLSEIEHVFL